MDYTAQEVIGMIHYRKRDLLSATSSTAVAGIISMECFFWGIMKMADLVIIQIHVIFFLRLCSSNFRNVEIFFWSNKLTVMPCQRTIQPNLPKVQTLTSNLRLTKPGVEFHLSKGNAICWFAKGTSIGKSRGIHETF